MYGQHIAPPNGDTSGGGGAADEALDLAGTALSPLSTVISFDDLSIYRIGGGAFDLYVFLNTRLALYCSSPVSQYHHSCGGEKCQKKLHLFE